MYSNLDQKLVKKSSLRAIVSGFNIEIFEYERPYLYNFPPLTKPSSWGVSGSRREDNIRACRNRLRRLINSNVEQHGDFLPKFVTFTFGANITSVSVANSLFTSGLRRLQSRFSCRLRYVAVPEFQQRGAVHYHVLFFNMPYVWHGRDFLKESWQQGNVDVKAIGHVKNVAAYMTKYMTKATLDSRLVGQKAFFTSRGLLQPVEIKDSVKILQFLEPYTMLCPVFESEYITEKYGVVKYKQINIKKHDCKMQARPVVMSGKELQRQKDR